MRMPRHFEGISRAIVVDPDEAILALYFNLVLVQASYRTEQKPVRSATLHTMQTS